MINATVMKGDRRNVQLGKEYGKTLCFFQHGAETVEHQ